MYMAHEEAGLITGSEEERFYMGVGAFHAERRRS